VPRACIYVHVSWVHAKSSFDRDASLRKLWNRHHRHFVKPSPFTPAAHLSFIVAISHFYPYSSCFRAPTRTWVASLAVQILSSLEIHLIKAFHSSNNSQMLLSLSLPDSRVLSHHFNLDSFLCRASRLGSRVVINSRDLVNSNHRDSFRAKLLRCPKFPNFNNSSSRLLLLLQLRFSLSLRASPKWQPLSSPLRHPPRSRRVDGRLNNEKSLL
jgi:hypothetical protein